MIAIDTNILTRFYIQDDDDREARLQQPIAARVLARPGVFVPKTVLLEFVWVAQALYGFGRADIVAVLDNLFGLANVSIEDSAAADAALRLYRLGFDFGYALHHGSSANCAEFISFDQRSVAKRAKRHALVPPVTFPAGGAR